MPCDIYHLYLHVTLLRKYIGLLLQKGVRKKRRAEKYFAHFERLKDLMKKLNHFGYHNFFKTYV